jgi:hypothetical protein
MLEIVDELSSWGCGLEGLEGSVLELEVFGF